MYAGHKPGVRELNPLYRGRAMAYGTQIPADLGLAWLAWHYKRQSDALRAAGLPDHKIQKWWLIQAINSGAHAAAIWYTLGATDR